MSTQEWKGFTSVPGLDACDWEVVESDEGPPGTDESYWRKVEGFSFSRTVEWYSVSYLKLLSFSLLGPTTWNSPLTSFSANSKNLLHGNVRLTSSRINTSSRVFQAKSATASVKHF